MLAILLLISVAGFSQNGQKLDPGELSAGSGFNAIIPLHWEKLGNPTEYHVFRKSDGNEFEQIATVPTGTFSSASYIDENISAAIEYTYIIKDQNNDDMTNESAATCNNTGYSITIPGWNTTTPTIDGELSSGEWDDAIEIDITNTARIYASTPLVANTYAYLKVADDKLFIAIKDFNSPTLEQNDQVMMFFDYNNDGLWSTSDSDQRYMGVYLDIPDFMRMRTPLFGEYPNVTFGATEYDPPEMQAEVAAGDDFVSYEFSFEISTSYLAGHTDNFGLLLQTMAYESGESIGLTGLFPPGAIWRAPTTFTNCTVQFDADQEPPEVISIEGNTTIANEEMNIIINISDQSNIQTVNGFYSIDGGEIQDLVMTPSKGVFGYTGTIPAVSEAATGWVDFYLEDVYNNSATSANYTIEWIGDDLPPVITLISAPTISSNGNIPTVSADVTDDLSGVESVTLFYTIDGQAEQSVSMNYINEIYIADLPDQVAGTYATYYITAIDNSENSSQSETIAIQWYFGDWFGHILGQNTGNNFGSIENMTLGVLLEIGDFEGKINKLAYMIPEYFNPPFNWKVVEVNINGNDVEWTDNVIVPIQYVTEELIYNASTWTEINVETDEYITGTVGLVVNMNAGSYWGRDENSTAEISWFIDSSGEWVQLGKGYWSAFPGDWNLKAHLYNESGVGIEKIAGQNNMTIFPNPATDFITVTFISQTEKSVEIELFDVTGKVINKVSTENYNRGDNTIEINTSNLPSGIYFIKKISENSSESKRFIVK